MVFFQVMREYTSKVDKLEEAEKLRAEEVKEENNKPIVMGEFQIMLTADKNFKMMDVSQKSCRSWFGCPCGFGCQCSSHSQMIPKLGSVIIFSQTYKLSYIFPRSLTLTSNDHSFQKPSPS